MLSLITPEASVRYMQTFGALPGVVGFWPLMESGGTFYRDLGPNNLNGTGAGTLTPTGLPGPVPYAGILGNGSTGLVNCGTSSAFDLGDNVSMVAMVLRGATGSNRAIMSKGGGGGPGAYYLRFNSDGTLHFLRSNVADMVGSTAAVEGTRPHHVVGTKAGSTVKLYVDGVDVTGSVSNSTLTNTARPFQIGCDQNSVPTNADHFNSRLAMVGLLGRALTAAEVYHLAAIARGAV